uniref:NADH dehydrogenase subunit 6 n=1 Tax=Anodonta anatina TaxID=143294 RepID=A0A023I1C9_ANOAN|nr:NADH dehydrogenase subunit 6 [Anodonta anatina]AGS17941.1 NADH dehydrogenase subunit 6 [Anodonta anatina]
MTLMLLVFMMIFLLMHTMTSSHPLILSLKVLLFAFTLCLTLSLNTTWYAYMIFLVMLGGVLVMFTYISSLASNSIFKSMINLPALLAQVVITSFMAHNFIKFPQKTFNTQKPYYPPENFITFFISGENCTILLLMASTLLLSMLIVSQLLSGSNSAMRTAMYH